MSEVIDLPIGGNRNAPLRAHVVEAIGSNELDTALVFHDTNGAPLFRFALNPQTGKFTFSPLTVELDLDMSPLMTIARAAGYVEDRRASGNPEPLITDRSYMGG